ncbi:peroxidase 54-like [Malania oleifera]|uniref:peroxidase 54-like n=1 Tax=Malania oleifera TaxID=397392 RepID=UPI0025ADF917|nr:peroxidase 54-like [Malania oleifera]
MGRKDGPKAGLAEANAGIPTPNSTLHEIIGKFQAVGLSISQMVALSGGHTIGRARCESFADRLSNFKGTGAPDPTMDPNMLSELQKKCPQGTVTDDNNVTLVPLDRNSIDLFDNNYFKNLINSKGLLGSDQSLFSNISGSDAAQLTNDLVISFSNNAGIFTTSFVDAIIKMGQINVHTGADNGEIRKNCRSPNSLGVAS